MDGNGWRAAVGAALMMLLLLAALWLAALAEAAEPLDAPQAQAKETVYDREA